MKNDVLGWQNNRLVENQFIFDRCYPLKPHGSSPLFPSIDLDRNGSINLNYYELQSGERKMGF